MIPEERCISVSRYCAEAPPPEVTRMEFQMKDEMIRNTIMNTQEDVKEIKETLEKTNLNSLSIGSIVNIERGLKLGDRLDGHIVQGHVDQIGECVGVKSMDGSWVYDFKYDPTLGNITIEKGSVTVNGVSLTVVNSKKDGFSVAIIPYTYQNTNFKEFKAGSIVNLEFDVIGKYVSRLYSK